MAALLVEVETRRYRDADLIQHCRREGARVVRKRRDVRVKVEGARRRSQFTEAGLGKGLEQERAVFRIRSRGCARGSSVAIEGGGRADSRRRPALR